MDIHKYKHTQLDYTQCTQNLPCSTLTYATGKNGNCISSYQVKVQPRLIIRSIYHSNVDKHYTTSKLIAALLMHMHHVIISSDSEGSMNGKFSTVTYHNSVLYTFEMEISYIPPRICICLFTHWF